MVIKFATNSSSATEINFELFYLKDKLWTQDPGSVVPLAMFFYNQPILLNRTCLTNLEWTMHQMAHLAITRLALKKSPFFANWVYTAFWVFTALQNKLVRHSVVASNMRGLPACYRKLIWNQNKSKLTFFWIWPSNGSDGAPAWAPALPDSGQSSPIHQQANISPQTQFKLLYKFTNIQQWTLRRKYVRIIFGHPGSLRSVKAQPRTSKHLCINF